MGKFVKNKSGIIVPKEEKKEEIKTSNYPVKKGWVFSLCGQAHYDSQEDWFKEKSFEDMYAIINSLGYWKELKPNQVDKCKDLLNQLAVEILGGVPDEIEVFT